MARKKTSRTGKVARKKSAALKKKPAVKKKKAVAKKKPARKQPARKKSVRARKSRPRARQETTFPVALRGRSALDSASAGQSGDTQGLSRREADDSESVAELAEEGQYFEADAVSGVENAKDPDQGEVTTSEVPEDDVPPEYWNQD
jgi:hypothetical protein